MAAAGVPRRKLGPQAMEVSAQGLGCMSMTSYYGAAKPEHEMVDLIHHAVRSGVTFLDTSDVYGPHINETLVGKGVGGIREQVQIGTKFGIHYSHEHGRVVRGDPAYVRASCEASLKRLGVDCIDLYYQHRVDVSLPIEITIGEMKKLVEEGKVKYIGLSEASASTIRRAHAVHPITAVQIEWSLWSRDVEQYIVPTCRELGIGIVAYSPLGRGFFSTGPKIVESFADNDFRKVYAPRFQGKNLECNAVLFNNLSQISARKGCTPGQLALAWVQNQGDDVVPIPGTTRVKNFEENVGALNIKLTTEEMQEIESLFCLDVVAGDRYLDMSTTYLASETPALSSWPSA